MRDAPPSNGTGSRPQDDAPTGQSWKPVETDEGCGRNGVRWVLVDEVCEDGEGTTDPRVFNAPMFRDGALVGDHLLAVDATHLWSLDLGAPGALKRSALVTGLGQPLAVDKRGAELVLASGTEGLVLVDASNPVDPTRSRSLSLPGLAVDVRVAGDIAFVALGRAGVAEVDLAPAQPTLKRTFDVGGFSAGVAVRDHYAFVAACSTFKVVDLETGQVVSQAWVPQPIVKDRLVAPAKKVTLVDDVAFVAAGRYGAVAIDVADPKQPSVIGNCTVSNAPSFYASGVRASGDKLFVAGGEWGILPVPASDAKAACPVLKMQVEAPPEESPCSGKPPWEIVPWEKIWAPPPPAKDPIQTLPVGDRVYAFGDARRIGTRAVDVRDAKATSLPLVDRFDEPRALLGVAASGDRVVAVGPRGGIFRTDPTLGLVRSPSADDVVLAKSTSVVLSGDNRWVALEGSLVHVEGASTIPFDSVTALATKGGSEIVVSTKNAIELVNIDTRHDDTRGLHKAAVLPLSIAADATGIYYAAPEWTAAAKVGGSMLEEHGVFDEEDILDPSRWTRRLPRRLLVTTPRGLVEIAGVGPAVGFVLHATGGKKKTPLVPMTYVAAASDGQHVYVIGIDRSLYKSYLVSVSLANDTPKVLSFEAFTGAASGVATANGRVYVADADGVLRVYTIAADGAAAPFASIGVP